MSCLSNKILHFFLVNNVKFSLFLEEIVMKICITYEISLKKSKNSIVGIYYHAHHYGLVSFYGNKPRVQIVIKYIQFGNFPSF